MKKLVVLKQFEQKVRNEDSGEKTAEIVNTEFIIKEDDNILFSGNAAVNGFSLYAADGNSKLDINSILELMKNATDAEEIDTLD